MYRQYDEETLKRVQNTEKEILVKFIEICEKYNLKYFAAFGTLLGAIRHRGFIPWDDDIDVGMLRKDYEKFLKDLPIISLDIERSSKFSLRRGQEDGNLCTVETAIELLKMNKENNISEIIDKSFELFLESYKAGMSGHKIK